MSLEIDIVLGAWTSINNIPGRNFAIGLGTDTADLLNEYGTDESGGNFKIIYNADRVIGGTLSLGSGYGPDLPIDNEISYESCHTNELLRLNWKKVYSGMKKIVTNLIILIIDSLQKKEK